MSGAYERAARRLAALTGEERDWILARLSRGDAQRVRDLMEPKPAAEPLPVAPPARDPRQESNAHSLLEQASPADVSQALEQEPDWFVALLLAKRRWPWDREVLAAMEPARLDALGALAQDAREAAKTRACEAAMEVLAARLRELAPPPAAPSAFDDLLAGMLAGGGERGDAQAARRDEGQGREARGGQA